MAAQLPHCPLWVAGPAQKPNFVAYGHFDQSTRVWHVEYSPRAAGGFILPEVIRQSHIRPLTDVQKARLSTWLIDQRTQGNEQPLVTESIVEYIKAKPGLAIHNRVDRLLKYISEQTTNVGTTFDFRKEDQALYAWSESTSVSEIGYLVSYLVDKNWLDFQSSVTTIGLGTYSIPALVRVTVDGHAHIGEQITRTDSSQSFVAMWFDEQMKEAFDNGIEPAIRETGYKPLRIDQKEHINKIDDEIIAEIRRSRFLVADFTHGEAGVRGGVYYEAGFAHGLGIPVIFTCREDAVGTLHFDTNHYNHIVWTASEDLLEKLKNRILAVIGEGPEQR